MREPQWTFFSNHAHVYFILAKQENITIREIASLVGITERSVHGIISDLENEGYLRKKKVGRKNSYALTARKTLRHHLEHKVHLKQIVDLINPIGS